MDCLKIELLRRLQCHKLHRRTLGRPSKRIGVSVVSLGDLHVGPNIEWRHQAHLASVLDTEMANVVRAAACLKHHDAKCEPGQKGQKPLPLDALAQNTGTGFIQTSNTASRLPQVYAQYRNLYQNARSFSGNFHDNSRRFGEQAVHPIRSLGMRSHSRRCLCGLGTSDKAINNMPRLAAVGPGLRHKHFPKQDKRSCAPAALHLTANLCQVLIILFSFIVTQCCAQR